MKENLMGKKSKKQKKTPNSPKQKPVTEGKGRAKVRKDPKAKDLPANQ